MKHKVFGCGNQKRAVLQATVLSPPVFSFLRGLPHGSFFVESSMRQSSERSTTQGTFFDHSDDSGWNELVLKDTSSWRSHATALFKNLLIVDERGWMLDLFSTKAPMLLSVQACIHENAIATIERGVFTCEKSKHDQFKHNYAFTLVHPHTHNWSICLTLCGCVWVVTGSVKWCYWLSQGNSSIATRVVKFNPVVMCEIMRWKLTRHVERWNCGIATSDTSSRGL